MTFIAALCLYLPNWVRLPRKPKPPRSAKEGAPVDFTGYWVSVVTEDWRWRMVTPIKGDFASIPLSPAGRAVGNAWDPAKDEAAGEQCKSYGAPAVMRIPGPSAHHLGGRQYLADRYRPGHADAAAAISSRYRATRARDRGRDVRQRNWEPPVRGPQSPQQGLGATREGARGRSLEVVTTRTSAGLFAQKWRRPTAPTPF